MRTANERRDGDDNDDRPSFFCIHPECGSAFADGSSCGWYCMEYFGGRLFFSLNSRRMRLSQLFSTKNSCSSIIFTVVESDELFFPFIATLSMILFYIVIRLQ